ncbi:MAG: MCE family protein [Verrucomicrobia bacterium]|nr:MCE family protein [Verrucomicrobiota bacterium]
MSRKANPTFIGAFVLGAILIAVGAVVFFGSMNLFSEKQVFLTYFNQSVNGLTVGSNVKFKGVTIGQVNKILLSSRGPAQPPYVKVLYAVDTRLVEKQVGAPVNLSNRQLNERRVANGLRAKLDFESLISGQLYVSLDFYKNAPPTLIPPEPGDEQRYLIIPSEPSDIEAIINNVTKALSNLGNINFLALAQDVQDLVTSAREGIDAMHLEKLGASLNQTTESLNQLVNGPDVKGVLTSLHTSFDQLTATLKHLDTELSPAAKNLNPTLDEAKQTLASIQKTVTNLDTMLKPNSGLRYQLDSSLSQLGAAAASIQNLSDFLQRHPNSILFGRKPARQEQP